MKAVTITIPEEFYEYGDPQVAEYGSDGPMSGLAYATSPEEHFEREAAFGRCPNRVTVSLKSPYIRKGKFVGDNKIEYPDGLPDADEICVLGVDLNLRKVTLAVFERKDFDERRDFDEDGIAGTNWACIHYAPKEHRKGDPMRPEHWVVIHMNANNTYTERIHYSEFGARMEVRDYVNGE